MKNTRKKPEQDDVEYNDDGWKLTGQIENDGRPHYKDGHMKCCGMPHKRPPEQTQVSEVTKDQVQMVVDHLWEQVNKMRDEHTDRDISFELGRIAGAMSLLQQMVDRL